MQVINTVVSNPLNKQANTAASEISRALGDKQTLVCRWTPTNNGEEANGVYTLPAEFKGNQLFLQALEIELGTWQLAFQADQQDPDRLFVARIKGSVAAI